ncbi:RHS repeat domain-containing protein [Delftia deserti]|uniref:RHS repeat domain-containing protein n=1 Tax=Delftia deserti TaxID=1651218 RepID=A0ABW5ENH2_9BURK
MDRLTKAAPDQKLQDLGLPTEQYQYDAVHNRTFSGHQVGTWSYNADNQLTNYPRLKPFDATAQPVQTQVEYSPQGHTARESSDKGEKTYGYNAAERLTRYASTDADHSTPNIEANYRYDPLGRRISKEVKEGQNTKVIYFFYSVTGLLGETDEQGKMTRAYAFDPQKAQQGQWSTSPIWQAEVNEAQLTNRNTSIHYLHTDHLGTPALGTNKQGEITWKGVAEAFGATGALQQSQVKMNLRFPGQYFDVESGEIYNYERNYKSEVGCYIESDPIGNNGGLNFYVYGFANPLFYTDYYGTLSISWNTRWLRDLNENQCIEAFPGAGCHRYPEDSRTLAVAVMDGMEVRAPCKKDCGTDAWHLDQYMVNLTFAVHLRENYVDFKCNLAWIRRAEMDHISDHLNWARQKATAMAQSVEDSRKNISFGSLESCILENSSAMRSA